MTGDSIGADPPRVVELADEVERLGEVEPEASGLVDVLRTAAAAVAATHSAEALNELAAALTRQSARVTGECVDSAALMRQQMAQFVAADRVVAEEIGEAAAGGGPGGGATAERSAGAVDGGW